jgi:hypothetical protein
MPISAKAISIDLPAQKQNFVSLNLIVLISVVLVLLQGALRAVS